MMCLDLSEDQLLLKDRLCREILQVLEQLGAGRCRLRGTRYLRCWMGLCNVSHRIRL